MIRRPFFGLTKPKLKYPVIEKPEQSAVKELPLPKRATLMIHQADVRSDDILIKVGDTVEMYGYLGRDGNKMLSIMTITLADGTVLVDKVPE